MSQGAGTVVVQLDSQSATKVTNEHYRLQLAEPIHIPYLSQPRCNLICRTQANVQYLRQGRCPVRGSQVTRYARYARYAPNNVSRNNTVSEFLYNKLVLIHMQF
jgi:hypothetical protein